MKYFLSIILLVLLNSISFTQSITNGDLEGILGSSSTTFPISDQLPSWQNVDGADPLCMANTFASATPDVHGLMGMPSITAFSGQTFVTGLFGNFVYNTTNPNGVGSQFFDEGIMQTVNGFTPGTTYNLHFHQSPILTDFTANVSGCWDNSGSWEVFIDNTSQGVTTPTITSQPLYSNLIDWEERIISITATNSTHDLKFLPRDDDNNQTMISSGGGPNECIYMAIDSIWIELSNPSLNITGNNTICEGESTVLTASNGVNYSWATTSAPQTIIGTGNTLSVTPITTTTYNVYTTTDTTNFEVIVNEFPNIDIGMDFTLCQTAMIDATIANATYEWQNNSIGSTFTVNQPGTYWVDVTVNGCTARDSVIVNSSPSMLDGGADLQICKGEEFSLHASGLGNVIYTWDNGVLDNVPASINTTTLFTVTATDVNGCILNDTLNVTVHPMVMIDAGQDLTRCDNENVVLTGDGAGTNGSYVWNMGITDGDAFMQTTETATYTLVGTSEFGCTGTDSIKVNIISTPNVNFTTEQPLCSPEITFMNTTNIISSNCNWSINGVLIHSGCADFSYTPQQNNTFDVTLELTTQEGCLIDTVISISPNTEELPLANFSASTFSIFNGEEITFINNSTNATSFSWDFGDGSSLSTTTSPSHLFNLESGNEYEVTLIAYSDNGCSDTTKTNVHVEDDLIYYVPNAFTPDGDEFNQTFQPVFTTGFDPYDYKLLIFNRWGEIMFESKDANIGWDGTYKGSSAQDGVYTWRIEFGILKNDYRKVVVGNVVLLK